MVWEPTANGSRPKRPVSTAGAFPGILFDRPVIASGGAGEGPEHFGDLNLDQVGAALTAGREDCDLAGYFASSLPDEAAVAYRQAVFRDLDGTALCNRVRDFSARMATMRSHLAQVDKLHHLLQKQAWFLEAVDVYCQALRALAADLSGATFSSTGFGGLAEYLACYTASDDFAVLETEIQGVRERLAQVSYCVHIGESGRVTVSPYAGQTDYSAEVEATSARFAQGLVHTYRPRFNEQPKMNHVESRIAELVAELNPEAFGALAAFFDAHHDYLDPVVAEFDRQVQFYLAYLDYIAPLRSAGLPFCYPEMSKKSKEIFAADAFDVALAAQLVSERANVVTNDLALSGVERIFVVTGPNQGGKTTFARTFGQLHWLGALGCPVPGTAARLFLFDRLFTQFEREEQPDHPLGKLADDLARIKSILDQATDHSVIIFNEIFTSTTVADALALGTEVLRRVVDLGAVGVCVTFIDEWSRLGPEIVSMVAMVAPDDPAIRTYKIVRKHADGRAHAQALAEKYGLTYARLKERITR